MFLTLTMLAATLLQSVVVTPANKITVTSRIVNGVSCRVYTPLKKGVPIRNTGTMIYYHGGSYTYFVNTEDKLKHFLHNHIDQLFILLYLLFFSRYPILS